jgi:DNA-binding transcriptional ArsR family regulator
LKISHSQILLHPLRLRIVEALVNSPPLTPAALIERIPGVAQATLYRHLNLLTEVGIAKVASERKVRGVVEKAYTLGANALGATPEEILKAGPEQQFQFFANFVGMLMDQYGQYLTNKNFDLIKDGVGFRQTPFYATDKEFVEMMGKISAIVVDAYSRPPKGRRRRLLATVIMPDTKLS